MFNEFDEFELERETVIDRVAMWREKTMEAAQMVESSDSCEELDFEAPLKVRSLCCVDIMTIGSCLSTIQNRGVTTAMVIVITGMMV